MSWLEEIMESAAEVESPKQWIWWSAISAIAAISGSNVFLDKFYYKLSPNLFVMLLGKSGLGKGWPINLAKELVTCVDTTRVISGRNSIQAVLKELGTITTRNGKPPIPDSRGFLVSGEFVNFVIQDPHSLSVLTELYDTHYNSVWKNTTKGSGIDTLKNVCLTMLGASSPAHFREVVHAKDIEGGFLGRTLMVYEEQRGFINPLTDKPKLHFDPVSAAEHLIAVSKIRGEFSYSKKAKEAYKEWYYELRKKDTQDKTGTVQRIHNHVEKVAMCCALARDATLELLVEDIETSIEACTTLVTHVEKIIQGAGGKSEIAEHQAMVLQVLIKAPEYELTRQKVLQKLFGDVDSFVLNKVIETLTEAQAVTAQTRAGNIYYRLTPAYLKQLEAWKKRDKKS
jgi:ribosomal protein L17